MTNQVDPLFAAYENLKSSETSARDLKDAIKAAAEVNLFWSIILWHMKLF